MLIGSYALRFLGPVCQKAQQFEVRERTLLGTFGKGVATGIPDAKGRSLEQMHHALLLIEIRLIRELVEVIEAHRDKVADRLALL